VSSIDSALATVIARLTERDRYLCRLLAEHDILTTNQVCQAAFSGERRTSQRLSQLASLHVVDRIRPHTATGSAPAHWLLGTAGVYLIAADTDITVKAAGRRRDVAHELARGQRLAHHVGANGIFTSLLAAGRAAAPLGTLDVWWSARRCATEWGQLVRPDGYGVWTTRDGSRVPFLLEYDNGTERLARLAGKLDGYAKLAAAAGHRTHILFTFPTLRREDNARQALVSSANRMQLPVATAVTGDAAAPLWRPLGSHRPYTLGDLPAHLPAVTAVTAETWAGR
jgi:hypothetical protein